MKNAEELLESQFGKTRFKDSDSDINFYTEFPNYKTLYLKFGYLIIWPDRETIEKAMPWSFKDKYPKTRVIIDGTEIKCQIPSSSVLHSETYFSYKSHTAFHPVAT